MAGGCAIEDEDCICGHEAIAQAATGCLLGTCTMSEFQGTPWSLKQILYVDEYSCYQSIRRQL